MLVINVKKVFYLILLTTVVSVTSAATPATLPKSNNDLNNLLINDLNIIATKLDDIPETSMNLKLVLMAYECTDVKLNWKITNSHHNQHHSSSSNKAGQVFRLSNNKKQQETKIFGFQVVVREYLEQKTSQSQKSTSKMVNSEEIFEKQNEKTLRVYSSKFIESNQNKFKLINLLRRNMASYLICLIIYMDVTETVAFEKQCVNFSLPIVPKEMDAACERSGQQSSTKMKQSKLGTMTNSDESGKTNKLAPSSKQQQKQGNFSVVENQNASIIVVQPPQQFRNNTNSQLRPNLGSITHHQSNCEHVSQCKHYANLLVAFVVCGVLLGTNVFMFTIIIIQNTIKLGLLRHKLKIYKHTQTRLFTNLPNSSGSHFVDSNRDMDDKSFLHSNSKFEKYG